MLIVIEGIDGVGKATQTGLLADWLAQHGVSLQTASSPNYRTRFGRVLSEYLNGVFGPLEQVHPTLSATCYLQNMRENVDQVTPRGINEIRKNHVILSDRYVPSTCAYQSARLAAMLDEAAGENLEKWIMEVAYEDFKLPKPDLVIQLDAPVELSSTLVAKKRGREYTDKAADLHEANHSYLKQVRRWYDRMAAGSRGGAQRWITVPIWAGDEAGASLLGIQQVADKVRSLVESFLRNRGVLQR